MPEAEGVKRRTPLYEAANPNCHPCNTPTNPVPPQNTSTYKIDRSQRRTHNQRNPP